MHKRSAWKIPFVYPIFFDNNFFKSKVSVLKLMNRKSIFSIRLLRFVKKISLYSGKTWKSFIPRALMFRLKLGDFVSLKYLVDLFLLVWKIKQEEKNRIRRRNNCLMGYLINPVGFRVGQTTGWVDTWFAYYDFYPEFLHLF